MPSFEIKYVSNSKVNWRKVREFMQEMADLLEVGQNRYGHPHELKKYMTRLEAEVKAYKKKGNRMQLPNAANYCILESIAPEHPNHHSDYFVKSVTRRKLG